MTHRINGYAVAAVIVLVLIIWTASSGPNSQAERGSLAGVAVTKNATTLDVVNGSAFDIADVTISISASQGGQEFTAHRDRIERDQIVHIPLHEFAARDGRLFDPLGYRVAVANVSARSNALPASATFTFTR